MFYLDEHAEDVHIILWVFWLDHHSCELQTFYFCRLFLVFYTIDDIRKIWDSDTQNIIEC